MCIRVQTAADRIALVQAKNNSGGRLTLGLILTKLGGTAKGGYLLFVMNSTCFDEEVYQLGSKWTIYNRLNRSYLRFSKDML